LQGTTRWPLLFSMAKVILLTAFITFSCQKSIKSSKFPFNICTFETISFVHRIWFRLFHFHSFVDEIKKCMEPLEMCKHPRHVQRLREYIDEIKSDVCTQETIKNIFILNVFSYVNGNLLRLRCGLYLYCFKASYRKFIYLQPLIIIFPFHMIFW
jgi:hypothetical protein